MGHWQQFRYLFVLSSLLSLPAGSYMWNMIMMQDDESSPGGGEEEVDAEEEERHHGLPALPGQLPPLSPLRYSRHIDDHCRPIPATDIPSIQRAFNAFSLLLTWYAFSIRACDLSILFDASRSSSEVLPYSWVFFTLLRCLRRLQPKNSSK